MNTVLDSSQTVLLHNISWNSYKQIADALQDQTPAHLTYDRGRLEIMVLSFQHENLKKLIAMLFERLTEDLDIEICAAGSTTFQKEDLERGFEPDESYYIENAAYMRGRKSVNLDFDPPPDLSIEIDVTQSSINRMNIFAAIGIREVWRCHGSAVEFSVLHEGKYEVVSVSKVLSGVSSAKVTELIKFGLTSTRRQFMDRIDEYAASLKN
ncbi:MAG TPA: Uma2 family endonuclease [Pyrinomonadaceae bacterium]|jgi:Uma2 family endonuclease|nr:Uma2 family endonuclease [Pyrinomonadaceae bacterium]